MIPERAQVILDFWFKETPSEMHFKKDENFDQKLTFKTNEAEINIKIPDWVKL